jgi:hypothetical protein
VGGFRNRLEHRFPLCRPISVVPHSTIKHSGVHRPESIQAFCTRAADRTTRGEQRGYAPCGVAQAGHNLPCVRLFPPIPWESRGSAHKPPASSCNRWCAGSAPPCSPPESPNTSWKNQTTCSGRDKPLKYATALAPNGWFGECGGRQHSVAGATRFEGCIPFRNRGKSPSRHNYGLSGGNYADR